MCSKHDVCLVSTCQSGAAELSKVRDELAASKTERSSLQAKVVQLTTALKSVLATKVSLVFSVFDCSACWPTMVHSH